jgi:hypothetical protein
MADTKNEPDKLFRRIKSKIMQRVYSINLTVVILVRVAAI